MFVTVTAHCFTDPRFIFAKYLTEYSENCKVTPISRVWPEYSPPCSPQDTEIQAATKLLTGGNICEPRCNLRLVMLHVTFCKWVSNFATLLLTTFSSKLRSIVWWRSNHCDFVTMKFGLSEITSTPPLIGWILELRPLIGCKISKVPFDVADNTRFHEQKTMNLWQAAR